uniref:Ig-like domain-containing protein n=1 Tax=Chelonoidis abingdonii TaxID=106734 RepID=A0A8C0GXT5_CHEAB
MERQLTAWSVILSIQVYCKSRGVSCQIKVDQSPPSLTRAQGEFSILTCSYSGTVSYVQWYRQFPGESPAFLLSLYKDGNVTQEPKFIAELLKRERRSHLHIDGSQLADSASYFCAVRHSETKWPPSCTKSLPGRGQRCTLKDVYWRGR